MTHRWFCFRVLFGERNPNKYGIMSTKGTNKPAELQRSIRILEAYISFACLHKVLQQSGNTEPTSCQMLYCNLFCNIFLITHFTYPFGYHIHIKKRRQAEPRYGKYGIMASWHVHNIQINLCNRTYRDHFLNKTLRYVSNNRK